MFIKNDQHSSAVLSPCILEKLNHFLRVGLFLSHSNQGDIYIFSVFLCKSILNVFVLFICTFQFTV